MKSVNELIQDSVGEIIPAETLEETRDRIMRRVRKEVEQYDMPLEIERICFNLVLDFYNARVRAKELETAE